MTIFTDSLGHLITDGDVEELHRFAVEGLGLKRKWFQNKPGYPHYDLTTENAKRRAIEAGAILISPKKLVKKLPEGGDRNHAKSHLNRTE